MSTNSSESSSRYESLRELVSSVMGGTSSRGKQPVTTMATATRSFKVRGSRHSHEADGQAMRFVPESQATDQTAGGGSEDNGALTQVVKEVLGGTLRTEQYSVVIENDTGDTTFTEIAIFFRQGVDLLTQNFLNVAPGQIKTFHLGDCHTMQSYAVGFWIGNDMVARIPEEGNMTAELASQLDPSDTLPCSDGWEIY